MFAKRLQKIMQVGNLTVADLARWFERPYPTVRQWATGVHDAGGAPLDRAEIERRLRTLERMAQQKRGLPVPKMTPAGRISYLSRLLANPDRRKET